LITFADKIFVVTVFLSISFSPYVHERCSLYCNEHARRTKANPGVKHAISGFVSPNQCNRREPMFTGTKSRHAFASTLSS
jgi:hypothetical protein